MGNDGSQATLVYLYGPPAVGKLTVATELRAATGFRLFHNHLSVNAIRSVFEFASPPFIEVLHRFRLDVFETTARAGIDLIFTNNSIWAVPGGRARFASFADETRRRVETSGGRVVFVQLTAPAAVLEARVAAESRREHAKLLDAARLREMLGFFDPTPLHEDDLVLDTSALDPAASAAAITAALAVGADSRPGP